MDRRRRRVAGTAAQTLCSPLPLCASRTCGKAPTRPYTPAVEGRRASEVSQRFPWTVPDGVADDACVAVEEIVRRGRRNEQLGDAAGYKSRVWARVNLLMGGSAVLFAALSGAVAIKDSSPTVAGVLAAISAALAALVTFAKPSETAAKAKAEANAHWRISGWARREIALELRNADLVAARRVLLELDEREDQAMVSTR